MACVCYPASLPTNCAMELISLWRKNELFEKKGEALLHFWNLQGFVQKVTFPPGECNHSSPDDEVTPTPTPTPTPVPIVACASYADETSLITDLEEKLSSKVVREQAVGFDIDPNTLALIIKLLSIVREILGI